MGLSRIFSSFPFQEDLEFHNESLNFVMPVFSRLGPG